LAKKFTLALTFDLFKSPSSVGQTLTFWTFPGEHSRTKGQNCQIDKIFRDDYSEKHFKRMLTPEWSVFLNFSEEQVAFSHPRQFKRTVRMR
jgi:hypothetical protein